MAIRLADQYHSIQIIDDDVSILSGTSLVNGHLPYNGVNTWDDFRLIPASRPVIAPPSPKYNYLDTEGGNGSLDGMDWATGYPLYNNREGSIDFYVTRDYGSYYSWINIYEKVLNAVHGQKVKLILNDDPGWYYVGRLAVNQWASEKDFSKITFDYNLEPFKKNFVSSMDEWLWDPFNFENGVIYGPETWSNYRETSGSNPDGYVINLNRDQNYGLPNSYSVDIKADAMPISPIIYVKGGGTGSLGIHVYNNATGQAKDIWELDMIKYASGDLDIGLWALLRYPWYIITNRTDRIRFSLNSNHGVQNPMVSARIKVSYRKGKL